MNNVSCHPISQIVKSISEDVVVEFSIYKYRPQSILDDREVFYEKISNLDEGWLDLKLKSLQEDKELALHSRFKLGRRYYHIPMIDFSCPVDDLENARKVLLSLLPKDLYESLSYYDSGRSIHAYGATPIVHNKWIEFMGRLLLVNLPGKPSFIDARWIGHRLVGGYSALRWSANSDYYLKVPEKIS